MARATRTRGGREMPDTDPTLMESVDSEAGELPLPDPAALPEEDLLQFVESALPQLSIESLGRIGEAVRQIRHTKQEEAKQSTRQLIEAQLQASGLSLRDLFPELLPGRRGGEGGPIPPKFRGP